MTNETKKAGKRWAFNIISLTFAIALALLYLLVLRSIAVQVAPPPKPLNEPYPDISTQPRCEEAGGRWIENGIPSKSTAVRPLEPVIENQPYCQGPLAFEREREAQNERSQQASLFVFAVGGGLAIVASLLIKQLKPVSPGLMIGSIVAFFIAGIHVWTLAPGIGRLITILIIFLVLIGIGSYVFRGHEKTEKEA